MVNRTELLTLHSLDLLEMLGTRFAASGTLTLMTGGEEMIEVDLDDLCMVVKIESSFDGCTGRENVYDNQADDGDDGGNILRFSLN